MHFLIAIHKYSRKNNSKEKKNHLIKKFEILKNSTGKKRKQKITLNIKQAIINLTDIKLTEEQKSLLNLGPNFVPATKRMHLWTLFRLQKHIELIRKKASNKLIRNFYFLIEKLHIKLLDNLSKPQKQSLVQMKNNKDTIIYPFDQVWIELFRIIWAFI